MTKILLEGVALRTHGESYPFDVNPYNHQIEVQRLVRDHERFVAVNDSPTGGGKTSSWLAPAFEQQLDTIAIYPTNALVGDQYEAIEQKIDEAVDHDVAILAVTSRRLHELSEEYDVNSHGEAIDEWYRAKRRVTDQRILLTNPDIFVMLRRDLYRHPIREYKRFELAVVDEFHRAGRKEQNTLRYLLDEMQTEDEAVIELRQVAFLSATPDERQEKLFEQAMAAPYHRVTETDENERRPFTDSLDSEWYPAMPPVELDVRTSSTFGTADVLTEGHREDTLSFCRGGRTVIMLDGIHEVERVFAWLDDEVDGTVERIDGFHDENKTEKLSRFDVLVSNSAVEVGIDFDVDRILFSGHDRDSFLQRLGRLRSKTDWKSARCYVPRYVSDTLAEHHDQTLTRNELDDILNEAYPRPRQPKTFDARYSAAEAFRHLDERLWDIPSDEKQEIKSASLARTERHFGVGIDTEFSLRDMKTFTEALDPQVLTALQWYRGDSIQALVYDRTADRITTYQLFYLLRYGDVEFFDRKEFERQIPAKHAETIKRSEPFVEGFCTFDGTIETTEDGYGRDVYFSGGMLYDWLDGTSNTSRTPQVRSGLQIGVDPGDGQSRVRSVSKVNKRLRDSGQRADSDDGGLLCYPVTGVPSQVKHQYDLGDFFFLYPIRVQSKEVHSLAIGTDALYLHCHVLEQDSALFGVDETDFLDEL